MTREEHMAEAERLLAVANLRARNHEGNRMDWRDAAVAVASIQALLAQAQVHATLAVAKQ